MAPASCTAPTQVALQPLNAWLAAEGLGTAAQGGAGQCLGAVLAADRGRGAPHSLSWHMGLSGLRLWSQSSQRACLCRFRLRGAGRRTCRFQIAAVEPLYIA